MGYGSKDVVQYKEFKPSELLKISRDGDVKVESEVVALCEDLVRNGKN